MNRFERIAQMEAILDKHQELADRMEQMLMEFEEHQKAYQKLYRYYGSEAFMRDVEASNRESFPADVKCGVLSEDAVFDLIGQNEEIALRMLEIAGKIFRER